MSLTGTRPQSGEQEAIRIGSAYASLVAAGMSGSRPVWIDRIDGPDQDLTIDPREVSRDDLADAEKIMKIATKSSKADLTAEDLARGDIAVRKIFARELFRFQREKPASYRVPFSFSAGSVRLHLRPSPGNLSPKSEWN